MKDVQKIEPKNKIDIDEVGIKGLRVPLLVLDKRQGQQQTVGEVSLGVNLPEKNRGTHMSRLVEMINRHTKKILSTKIMDKIVAETMVSLDAYQCKLTFKFHYFISKSAPVSKKKSLLGYQCQITSLAKNRTGKIMHRLEVKVPIATVCPCSKAISRYGAHNQRSVVTVSLEFNTFLWIEDVIRVVEKEASCSLYSLLKRADEKYVTEKGYENPKFVEDVVRDVSVVLQAEKKINWFKVECESFESIHGHNVFARIERDNKS